MRNGAGMEFPGRAAAPSPDMVRLTGARRGLRQRRAPPAARPFAARATDPALLHVRASVARLLAGTTGPAALTRRPARSWRGGGVVQSDLSAAVMSAAAAAWLRKR
ncbi:MAG: hypothetical protein NVS3B26_24250 [Mycobacteriales bacterium]